MFIYRNAALPGTKSVDAVCFPVLEGAALVIPWLCMHHLHFVFIFFVLESIGLICVVHSSNQVFYL